MVCDISMKIYVFGLSGSYIRDKNQCHNLYSSKSYSDGVLEFVSLQHGMV